MVELEECEEGRGNVGQYVDRIIAQGLCLTGSEFEVERAHLSLALKPDVNKPPNHPDMVFMLIGMGLGSADSQREA